MVYQVESAIVDAIADKGVEHLEELASEMGIILKKHKLENVLGIASEVLGRKFIILNSDIENPEHKKGVLMRLIADQCADHNDSPTCIVRENDLLIKEQSKVDSLVRETICSRRIHTVSKYKKKIKKKKKHSIEVIQ